MFTFYLIVVVVVVVVDSGVDISTEKVLLQYGEE